MTLLRDFLTQCHARYSLDALNMPMSEWACRNTTLRGKPFSLEGYEFQRRLLDDMHPNFSCIKISQVGLTEISARKTLGFLERNQGTTGLFTFPNQPMRDKNAKTRFKPIVDSDEVFNKERDKDATRSALLYQLGLSFLHITDCTEGAATSTPADIVLKDETDLSDQAMLSLFQSRLENSDYRISQDFSTPTHIQFGIDALYAASDQMEYLVRCTHCGHHNIPDFTRNFVHIPGLSDEIGCLSEIEQHHLDFIDLEAAYVWCEKCHQPLDLTEPSLREWVPTFPSRTLSRGYRVRPFSTSRRTIPNIVLSLLRYRQQNYLRGWWNTVIGKAYTAGNERLNVADIEACLASPPVPDLSTKHPIAVGIDSGIMCHVTLFDLANPNFPQPFSFQVVHSERLVEHIRSLAQRYEIIVGGMDRHPQSVLANQVHAASNNTIWPIEYRGTKDINPVKDVTNTMITHYQCDRTASLDRVHSRVRSRNLVIRGYDAQRLVLINHLTNMVRDEKPEEPAKWLKLSEDDHYFHALGFGLTALRIHEYSQTLVEADPRTTILIHGVNSPPPTNLFGRTSGYTRGPLGLLG